MRAEVVARNGVPVMEIGGEAVKPHIFFFNTEVEESRHNLAPQVRLARDAGVHIYSFPLPWPWEGDDFSEGEALLQAFVDVDPDALFVPRMRCEGSPEWLAAHPEACVRYADGSRAPMSSMASDDWWAALSEAYPRALRHYEQSAFGDRIIAYHPAGQNSNEWFHYEYWLRGPDYSDANVRRFRAFLAERYGDDGAFCAAWGRDDASLETASIPGPYEREACREGAPGRPFRAFLEPPSEQDRRDFYDYTNAVMAERVLGIARMVKEATERRKLVVLFYGYFHEMHAVEAGHYAMEAVLRAPDVDILSSPLGYMHRMPGGPGDFMTAVDSVALHGKLWVVENDYRTHSLKYDELPEWMTEDGLGPQAPDRAATIGVMRREYGAMLAHRCGTWWMDLIAGGAWSDPAVWDDIADRLGPLYDELLDDPRPYRPELGVICDEASVRGIRFPGFEGGLAHGSAVFDECVRHARAELVRSGVTCGWYYLGDFIEGRVPVCRAYWFLNGFGATAEQIDAIRARLDREGATAIWQYAPGWQGCAEGAQADAYALTGFDVTADAGDLATSGAGAMEGLAWGDGYVLDPRLAVRGDAGEVLGCYRDGGGVAAAVAGHGDHRSVFIGAISVPWAVRGALLNHLGLHRWVTDGSVARTDGRVLFVHSHTGGSRCIHLPDGVGLLPLDGGTVTPSTGGATLTFAADQTRILRLTLTKNTNR
jgi:hypothetical protein